MTEQPQFPANEPVEPQPGADQSFTAGVAADQDVYINGGGAFGVAAGRDVQLTDGGAFKVAVGRDFTLNDGGAVILTVNGSAELTDSSSVLAVCNDVTAHNSQIGVLLTREANLSENSTVLLDTRQAVTFGAAFGAVFGVVFALLGWLLRRKG